MACAAMAVTMLLALAGGCGGDEEPSADADATAAGTPAKAVKPDTPDTSKCKQVKAPKLEPASYDAPAQTVRKGEELTAVVETTCGTFEIELDAKRSPTTVNSFVFLARQGFYEGLEFDEAAPGTYLHAGNPPGKAVGPGYTVKGEVPEKLIYRHRVVAMAQPGVTAEGISGSQLFIVLAKPWIDTNEIYPPLGKVSKGFDVLERINALGPPDIYPGPSNIGVVGTIGKLQRPVLIERISIEKR